jgi:hypothetical protein
MMSSSVIDVNSRNHIPILLASPMLLYVVSELIPWWFYEAGKGTRSARSTYPVDSAAADQVRWMQTGCKAGGSRACGFERCQGRCKERRKEGRTYGGYLADLESAVVDGCQM